MVAIHSVEKRYKDFLKNYQEEHWIWWVCGTMSVKNYSARKITGRDGM